MLTAAGFPVVGSVGNGSAALEAVLTLRPDAVLLDVQLPDCDGIALSDRLREIDHALTVLLISSRDAADYGPRLRASAAAGFIAKADLSPASVDAVLAAPW